jgi:quercetin dioxygenase-like cupin family protein
MNTRNLIDCSRLLIRRSNNWRFLIALAALGVSAAVAWATPSVGFLVNEILAKGITSTDIFQSIHVKKNADGTGTPWKADIHTQGATDFYVQHLVLAPGGYSGWHSHPGILIATVVSGTIDFYDSDCQRRTVTPGGVYFENGNPHGIVNTGKDNADLSIAYLIKHDAPRRIEASAPACAASTPIP